MDRKVLCIYEGQHFKLASEFNKVPAQQVFLLDVAELTDIQFASEGFTDIVLLGFPASEETMEKLYMLGKKQIVCIDFYRADHPLMRLKVPKMLTNLLNHAGKWCVLPMDEIMFEHVVWSLTQNET